MIGTKKTETEPIFQTLADLNIPYEIQEHKAIFSEEDAKDVVITLEGIDVKNLFVKDKNGNYGLVSMNLHRRADLKKIAALFGFGRLSFCNADELMQYLNITPGSVSPLCVMFDTTKTVKVLYDSHFEGRNVIIHPLRNTASISIKFDDLKRFTEHFGHNWQLGDFYVAPNVEFVPLQADDAPAISEMSAMATEILRDYYDPIIGKEQNDYMLAKFQTVSAITDNLHHGYRFYFVRSDGRNAGFMAFYPREGAMYLSKFYLYKHERGKGLARQMLAFLADETRRASLSAIELNVNKHNPTLQIYKSLGFTTIRAEKIDIGGGFYMDDYVERLEV